MPTDENLKTVARAQAQGAGVDPDFVERLIDAESKWNPNAVSPKGAIGLMQLLPTTAQQYGVTNLRDPHENLRAGIAYLKDLHQRYQGRQELIAAAYNAGPAAVDRAGGVPAYRETQAYVARVARPSAASQEHLSPPSGQDGIPAGWEVVGRLQTAPVPPPAQRSLPSEGTRRPIASIPGGVKQVINGKWIRVQ